MRHRCRCWLMAIPTPGAPCLSRIAALAAAIVPVDAEIVARAREAHAPTAAARNVAGEVGGRGGVAGHALRTGVGEDLHAGMLGEAIDADCTRIAQSIPGNSRDSHWYVLERLCALLGGNHDFLDAVRICGRALRHRWCGP